MFLISSHPSLHIMCPSPPLQVLTPGVSGGLEEGSKGGQACQKEEAQPPGAAHCPPPSPLIHLTWKGPGSSRD